MTTTAAAGRAYDVVVVGAGPAGSVLSARLARVGLRLLLVEASAFDAPRAGEFLSPQARVALNRSSVLTPRWEEGHKTVDEFAATWGFPQLVSRNYIFDARGHALALDRARFDRELAAGAVERGAQLLTRSRVRRVESAGGAWTIEIDRNKDRLEVRASFLVVCAGLGGAPIAGLSTKRRRIDRLICLGLRIGKYDGDCRPLIESYARGWTYSAGLASGELVINICTELEPLRRRGNVRSPAFFLQELAHCPMTTSRVLASRAATASEVSFFVKDASSGVSRPAVGEGWCLVGDHAQSVDPLSSGGIANALRHGELISEAALRSRAIRDIDLTEYARSLDASYLAYLKARRHFYGLEQRWPSPFWRRRQEGPLSVADLTGAANFGAEV